MLFLVIIFHHRAALMRYACVHYYVIKRVHVDHCIDQNGRAERRRNGRDFPRPS